MNINSFNDSSNELHCRIQTPENDYPNQGLSYQADSEGSTCTDRHRLEHEQAQESLVEYEDDDEFLDEEEDEDVDDDEPNNIPDDACCEFHDDTLAVIEVDVGYLCEDCYEHYLDGYIKD